MIPCWLAREHGYESWLVGYQMEESYPYAAMIPEVKLVFIANRGNVEREYVDFLSEQLMNHLCDVIIPEQKMWNSKITKNGATIPRLPQL